MLSALEKLVRLESPTDDLDACRSVIQLASDIAQEVLGSPAQIRDVNGRPVFWWGVDKPDVVILAHLDTVWPKGSFQPVWSIKEGTASGPGIFDMKAGFIQALFAMKGIDGSVALVATSDEETGSTTSKDFIKEISSKAKAVLVLEATLNGKVKTGRKGTAMYQVKIHGKASHAGLDPHKGINATVEMGHAILAISGLENIDLGTTVVPTMLRSGNTTNTVPDLAILDIDVRSFSLLELNRVDAAIRDLKAVNALTRYEITGGFNRPPLETTSTMALYERAERVAKALGMPPLGHASVGGASDGNFAAAAGAQVLDGLGAIGDGAHAAHEWVDITTLQSRSALLHALIKDILDD
ncbi:MAG: acetylornithine deacetylase [Actinobacteria bacterium]|nr:M20 family peptidase [Candidatus Planktophila sp.]PHX66892.1 MAG: acetylornithine deacetylase [Actinomycetota bacterium]